MATVKATLFSSYTDKEALKMLDEPDAPVNPLIQIAPTSAQSRNLQETRA